MKILYMKILTYYRQKNKLQIQCNLKVFFVNIDKLILRFTWKGKRARIANTKIEVELTLPDFQTYYKAAVIMTLWYQQKNGQVNQWNRIEKREIDPHKYCQVIFDKGAKEIQWRKDSFVNRWCWNNQIPA